MGMLVFPARVALATLPIGAARSILLSYGNIESGTADRYRTCSQMGENHSACFGRSTALMG